MDEEQRDEQQGDNPYAPPIADNRRAPLPPRISIPLALVLMAVIVGLFFLGVGYGVAMLLIAVPAYVRAVGNSLQRSSQGATLTTAERVVSFIGSVGVVIVCCIAGLLTFFTTCMTGLVLQWGVEPGAILGVSLCGFVAVAAVVYWLCWPRRGGKHE